MNSVHSLINIRQMKIFLLVVLILTLFFLQLPLAKAQITNPLFKNFGGRVLTTIYCTCMGPTAKLITVGPPNPGSFLYLPPASRQMAGVTILPSNWVIGNAVTGSFTACMTGTPPACTPAGFGELINIVGSSGI